MFLPCVYALMMGIAILFHLFASQFMAARYIDAAHISRVSQHKAKPQLLHTLLAMSLCPMLCETAVLGAAFDPTEAQALCCALGSAQANIQRLKIVATCVRADCLDGDSITLPGPGLYLVCISLGIVWSSVWYQALMVPY